MSMASLASLHLTSFIFPNVRRIFSSFSLTILPFERQGKGLLNRRSSLLMKEKYVDGIKTILRSKP